MRGDKALAGQVRPGAMKEILIWDKMKTMAMGCHILTFPDFFLQNNYSHFNFCLTKQISDTPGIDPVAPLSAQTSAS